MLIAINSVSAFLTYNDAAKGIDHFRDAPLGYLFNYQLVK